MAKRLTLAHEFLKIENEKFNIPKSTYKRLENILDEAERKIRAVKDPLKTLKNIGDFLEKKEFRYGKIDSFKESLDRKEIECLDYCVLYNSIAQSLDIELPLVSAPNHVFVRLEKQGRTINWETTCNSRRLDRYYITNHKIHPLSLRKGIYLKNLNHDETIALAYKSRAEMLRRKGKFSEAETDFRKAMRLFPRSVGIHLNLAVLLAETGRTDAAKRIYVKTKGLDPNAFEIYDGLAKLANNKGKYREAKRYYRMALKRAPENAGLLADFGHTILMENNIETAYDIFQKALEKDPACTMALNGLAAIHSHYAHDMLERSLDAKPQNHDALMILDTMKRFCEENPGKRS